MLVGLFIALGLSYVIWFTEWLRPAPIEIASQVRFSVQPPRFGRPAPKNDKQRLANTNQPPGAPMRVVVKRPPGEPGKPGDAEQIVTVTSNVLVQPAKKVPPEPLVERIGRPDKGSFDDAPGGAARVTFALDDWYQLTRIKVEDVPADGTAPNVIWNLVGKSLPLNSLLYGHDPTGMKPILEGLKPEALKPGVPYQLIVEAGRRRGTNYFKTVEVPTAE